MVVGEHIAILGDDHAGSLGRRLDVLEGSVGGRIGVGRTVIKKSLPFSRAVGRGRTVLGSSVVMFTTAGVTVLATSANPAAGKPPVCTSGRSSAAGEAFEA